MSLRVTIAALGLALASGSALAQTAAVDSARASGVVGERFDGYMGFTGSPSATLRSQVSAINIKRRALYSELAAARGVSPQDVGITAGCELLERVAVGQAYMLTDGIWRRRAADQAAPRPGYCGG